MVYYFPSPCNLPRCPSICNHWKSVPKVKWSWTKYIDEAPQTFQMCGDTILEPLGPVTMKKTGLETVQKERKKTSWNVFNVLFLLHVWCRWECVPQCAYNSVRLEVKGKFCGVWTLAINQACIASIFTVWTISLDSPIFLNWNKIKEKQTGFIVV